MSHFFPIREGILAPSLSSSVMKRIMQKIVVKDRDKNDSCIFWIPQRTTISIGKEKEEQIKRLIYHNCVGNLLPKEKVFQNCTDEKYSRCIQPLHLFKKECDTNSKEWKNEKKRKRHEYYESSKEKKNQKTSLEVKIQVTMKVSLDYKVEELNGSGSFNWTTSTKDFDKSYSFL